jgi:hypothetical protein
MDSLQMFKEQQINDYLSSIDLNNIDTTQLKNDLRNKLGEEPAVKFNYHSELMINEDGTKDKRVENLESVTIIFTVEREIMPGKTVPIPVTKTFLIG